MRASILSRVAILAGFAVALPHLFACLAHPVKPVQYDQSAALEEGISIAINKDVDILFVIDNSGSMGEEQERLSANFGAFIDVLEAPDVKANYRMAVTTTDYGNPRCTPDNFPRPANQGRFALSSCRSRIGLDGARNDFVFEPEMTDATNACTGYCDENVHNALQGEWRPTTIEQDDSEEARFWIENIEGNLNLPSGVEEAASGLGISAANAAFRCLGPQGINGCGFESQLESAYWALARAEEPTEINYGFLRDAAILSIVHVTDEADCSFNEAQQNIFLDLNNTWSWEEGASSPTSAVCWNAGVDCVGAGPSYSECNVVSKDINGNLTDDDAAAVLIPIEKYVKQLNDIELEKKEIDQNQEVLVSIIGGVPSGYDTMEAEIQYIDNTNDQAEQIKFGIGPGCISAGDGGSAIPPVRMRDFAEQFSVDGERNLFSICDENYSNALNAIANRIRDQIKPACFKSCVADLDPNTPQLDPNCTLVEENVATGDQTDIPECGYDPMTNELVVPPAATACFAYLFDKNGMETDSDLDNMSPECVTDGWNLEFALIRNAAAKAGSTVKATCELSDLVERDCPDLI